MKSYIVAFLLISVSFISCGHVYADDKNNNNNNRTDDEGLPYVEIEAVKDLSSR